MSGTDHCQQDDGQEKWHTSDDQWHHSTWQPSKHWKSGEWGQKKATGSNVMMPEVTTQTETHQITRTKHVAGTDQCHYILCFIFWDILFPGCHLTTFFRIDKELVGNKCFWYAKLRQQLFHNHQDRAERHNTAERATCKMAGLPARAGPPARCCRESCAASGQKKVEATCCRQLCAASSSSHAKSPDYTNDTWFTTQPFGCRDDMVTTGSRSGRSWRNARRIDQEIFGCQTSHGTHSVD